MRQNPIMMQKIKPKRTRSKIVGFSIKQSKKVLRLKGVLHLYNVMEQRKQEITVKEKERFFLEI